MTAAAGRRRPPLPALTGIRFVAALMVLLFHFGAGFAARMGAPVPVATLLANGYVGVSLFFILSGFIIAYTYEGRLSVRADYVNFFSARFSRIYPVYALTLVAALPLTLAGRIPGPPLTTGAGVAVIAMVQSWTVPSAALGFTWVTQAWTLSVELAFYLAAPLLLPVLARLPKGVVIVLLPLVAAVLALLWIPTIHPSTTNVAQPFVAALPIPILRMVEFLYGGLLCTLLLRAGPALAPIAGTGPTILMAALVLVLLASTTHGLGIGLAMALAGILLLQLAVNGGLLARWLATRTMLLFGASSYALYLIQSPVRAALSLIPDPRIGQILNPVVAIGLSVLVFRWWEEPARKYLRRRLTLGLARG